MSQLDSRSASARIRVFDQQRAEAAVRELLYAIGEDPDRDGSSHPVRLPGHTAKCSPGSTPTPTRC